MDSEIVCKLKSRYDHLSPLMLQRSVERAVNEVELFDILDTIPDAYPLVWNNDKRRWVLTGLFASPDIGTE